MELSATVSYPLLFILAAVEVRRLNFPYIGPDCFTGADQRLFQGGRGSFMSKHRKLLAYLSGSVAAIGAASLTATPSVAAGCQGPGAPKSGHTRCVTAIHIPGKPLQSFDISWVDAKTSRYYLADRANAGIDVIDTSSLTFVRTLPGFVGIVLNSAGTAVDNSHSGPDGVTTHGRWLYAGDGNSTLKVFDLLAPTASAQKQMVFTGGSTRVDEMALTADGKLLLAVNNAEDPPYGTLFAANGDAAMSNVKIITKVTIDPAIMPKGFGLGFEQSVWDPQTQRFYASLPIIANNPMGCNYGQLSGAITCSGGMVVIDPTILSSPSAVIGAFDAAANVGVVPLNNCGPNGITLGTHGNLMEGCTPGNDPANTGTVVINGVTKNYATVANITGSDEVWFNAGDNRYYLGASKAILPTGSPLGSGAVLGIVNDSSVLVKKIPQSSNSHSVAADEKRNLIFVPQVAFGVIGGDTNTTDGAGTPTVGQLLCGTNSGCIAVYHHKIDDEDDDADDGK
jgi:hypothetical protein